MKLIYDEQGRLSEILGSGENGDLTTNEVNAFKTYMDNEEKSKEKQMDNSKEVGDRIVSNIDKVLECVIKTTFYGMNEYLEYRHKWNKPTQPDPNNQNKTVNLPENPSSN